jgi:threonine dehydrogenase-like Zn-dependent dehydrogenase
MKAFIVEKDYTFSVREIPDPQINEFMAKVKTIGCGICGSDSLMLRGVGKGIPPEIYPIVLGHEAVGEVVEVGSKVVSYKVGDKVLCPFNLMPGDGLGSAWGAFAEYGTVFDCYAPGAEVLGPVLLGLCKKQNVLPAGIDPLEATMIITLRETAGAIRRFNIDANQSAAVFGLGPVGLSFIQFMKIRGVKPVIALDILDEKLDSARKFGADYVMNAKDPDHLKKIREICPQGLDHFVAAVGNTNLYNEAMEVLKEDGQVCAYGVPANQSTTLDWSKNANFNFILNFYQMTDAANEVWAHNQIMELIRTGVIKLSDYISNYFSFDEIIPVMERFLKKEFKGKVVIKF